MAYYELYLPTSLTQEISKHSVVAAVANAKMNNIRNAKFTRLGQRRTRPT